MRVGGARLPRFLKATMSSRLRASVTSARYEKGDETYQNRSYAYECSEVLYAHDHLSPDLRVPARMRWTDVSDGFLMSLFASVLMWLLLET